MYCRELLCLQRPPHLWYNAHCTRNTVAIQLQYCFVNYFHIFWVQWYNIFFQCTFVRVALVLILGGYGFQHTVYRTRGRRARRRGEGSVVASSRSRKRNGVWEARGEKKSWSLLAVGERRPTPAPGSAAQRTLHLFFCWCASPCM